MSTVGRSGTVGIIVNPHAGKDIRRLVSAASPTSDAHKIGIIRRVIVGAVEAGATTVLVSHDSHRLCERAAEGIDVEVIDGAGTGSALDTQFAARELWKREAGAVVSLGGDGTCRDVATGWPGVPLIAISTGTNNVYPQAVDGTSAGSAAALVATGQIPLDEVSYRAKNVRVSSPSFDEVALVEAALIDAPFVGARAVTDATAIRWIVACIADPASTGLASVAGRVHPLNREVSGGVLVTVGPGRRLRVPLAPGSFSTVEVESITPLAEGEQIELPAGGVIAYDGERTHAAPAGEAITASIERSGPHHIDVARTLRRAVELTLLDDRST